MNTYKKIGIGLGLMVVTLSVLILKSTTPVLAYSSYNQADIVALTKTLAFQDRSTITGTFLGQSIQFTDKDITDGTYNYKPDSSLFCASGGSVNGITLNGDPFSGKASSITATVDLDYTPDGTSGACKDTNPNKIQNVAVAQPGNALVTFQWSGADLNEISSNTTLSHTGDASLFEKNTSDSCGGGEVIILDSGSTSKGTEYNLAKAPIGNWPKFNNSHFANSSCYVASSQAIGISGSPGQAAANTGPGGNGSTANGDACAAASSTALAWIMCPLLNAANDALFGADGTHGLVGVFLSQLSFRVSDLNPNGGQAKVQTTWALIRDIASATLVIILLVMVISQAIGGGPFDAYTIKKLLPKLVAAIVIMQLSWVIAAWVIDVIDDIGHGLTDLMYAPFGGSANMTLGALLTNAKVGYGGDMTLLFVNWVGGLAALVLGVAALPVVMFMGFSAVLGVIAAFTTLVFRKILIIACLIFAPLAIVAWILPGTQSYYKLWKDNFLKALMMYPLAVAVIATGRIFAYVVGTQDNGIILLSMIFVFVGYFGVLFILPKTFKWGGTVMSAGSNAISNLNTKATNAGKEPVKGYFQRIQGERAKRYDPNAGWRDRTFRRIQSGHILPTERSRRLTIAAGDKWAGERNDEADAYVKRTQEKALSGYDKYDMKDGHYGRFSRDAAGYLDAAGNHVDSEDEAAFTATDREHAYVERLKGVEAGKQSLIDIAGNSEDSVTGKRAAQSAVKQLLDTHSEIELQSARIQHGANAGKRVSEVDMWRDTITNSPPHYSSINNSRPDMAPDLIESAEAKVINPITGNRGDTYDEAYADDNLANRQARIKAMDKQRLEITLDRMTPEALQSAHYGLFQDIARVNDPELSGKLASVLTKFQTSSGTIGVNAVGSLRGGKENHVNAALAASASNLDDIAPPRAPRTPPAPTPPTP